MPNLIAQNLSHSYAGSEALRDVSLVLRPGTIHAVVGPSGAGKSTLLNIVAGLLRPTGGSLRLEGGGQAQSLTASPPGTGVVLQPLGLWDHLTVRQHLTLVCPRDTDRVQHVLESTGLAAFRDHRPGALSSGQRQRLALARAIVHRPQWLLLDEPLAHLDGPSRDELREVLRQVFGETGAGVLMTTHQPDEALQLAETITVLLDRRAVQTGPARQVYERPVSLAAARMLGPASEISAATAARIGADGRRIFRPHHLRFVPDPSGPAVVRRCDFVGGRFHLVCELAGEVMLVEHDALRGPETRGSICAASPARVSLECRS